MLFLVMGSTALSYSVLVLLTGFSMLPMFFKQSSNSAHMVRVSAVLASVLLSACASKNPLIDDGATAKPASSTATAAASPATTSTAGTAAASTTPTNAAGGLDTQTTSLSTGQRVLWFFSPYRITVQQGNFISHETVAQIKTGMTREQVRFLAGTPLLNDIFHADRWDYPFRLQKGSGETTTSRIAVFFKENKVERIESGELPSEKDYLIRIAGPAPELKDGK